MLAGIKPHQPVTITFEDLKTFDFKLHVSLFCHIRIEYRISSVNLRSRHTEVFLGKGVLKRCSQLQESTHAKGWFQYTCFATLLKSHFGMGALLSLCCIFSEDLFLRTPLGGCFWNLHIQSEYENQEPEKNPDSQPVVTCSKLTIESRMRCKICSKLTIKTPERCRHG